MKVIEESFKSRILSKRIKYQVLFPRDSIGSKDKKTIPVLYLLHGLFGESKNWTDLTEISDLIEKCSFAVASFDAGNSWYADGIGGRCERYESFFTEEFISRIENDFKVGGSRDKRAIAGISMGGYGALKFALKCPLLFTWAGSMSGAFDAPRQSEQRTGREWEILGESIKTVFGYENFNETRQKNDLFQIISAMKNENRKQLPSIYFDCGCDDSFLQVNRELFAKFKEKEIGCSFDEKPGGHDWIYWNRQLKTILQTVEKVFENNSRDK